MRIGESLVYEYTLFLVPPESENFLLENDTIYYQERAEFDLMPWKKAFLRRVKKNYILNIKQENQWREVVLMKKDKYGNIIV